MENTNCVNRVNAVINPSDTEFLSPYVFGHNLEHTRACMFTGLSAQMLRNRKFAGKPSKNEGCPLDWFAIGSENTFYCLDPSMWDWVCKWTYAPYTRHFKENAMRRQNEIQCLDIQNLNGGISGIGQERLYIEAGKTYELRAAARSDKAVKVTFALTDRDGIEIYARTEITVDSREWEVYSFNLVPAKSDTRACLRITFTQPTRLILGALSMLPEGHFRGMRRDVIANLKQLGVSLLRWPGGNFAGEYRWQDMFLPVDQRAPLQACTEIETQPFTYGYDFHEIDTDDFVALCREIGAEPFITINLGWDSPEESAAWVEYCNGDPSTPYGKKRAERGHSEPYNVRFWALGNEMGYGHMEGPMTPEAYALLAGKHADAMLAVTPGLNMFSSGPFPDRDWGEKSSRVLKDRAAYTSLHSYSLTQLSFTPELVRDTYEMIVHAPTTSVFDFICRGRATIDPDVHVSLDEWNYWYAWNRPTCVTEGLYAAVMLHMLMRISGPMNIPICCYFQPVGEGAIEITPGASRLTATGQVFKLMKEHRGGRLCRVSGAEEDQSLLATVKDGILTVTLYNISYDENREFALELPGELCESVLLSSESVLPHTRFTETALDAVRDGEKIKTTLPPHSAASIKFRL